MVDGAGTERAIGLQLLRLAEATARNEGRQWVLRREERVELLSARLIRRTVRAHIDLGPWWPDQLVPLGKLVLLPIALIDRRRHARIEVRSESGAIMSRLTRQEERNYLYHGLVQQAELVLRRRTLPVEVDAALRLSVDGLPGTEPTGPMEFRSLIADKYMANAMRQVGNYFHLLVPVNVEEDGLRRVITYTYLWPVSEPKIASGVLAAPVEIVAASHCRSYHLDINAPTATRFTYGVAECEAGRDYPSLKVTNDSHIDNELHVHIADAKDLLTAECWFELALSTTSPIRTALLVSTLGWLALVSVVLVQSGLVPGSVENPAAPTLFILVPGVAAPALARVQRHPVRTAMLSQTQFALWSSGLAAFVAAGALALGLRGVLLAIGWTVALLLSSSSVLVLVRQMWVLRHGASEGASLVTDPQVPGGAGRSDGGGSAEQGST